MNAGPWIIRTHRGALHLPMQAAAGVPPHVLATFHHACAVFGFLIERGERVTPLDWCERIENRYAPHHRRARVVAAIQACTLDRPSGPHFSVDHGEPIGLAEFVRVNRDDADVCEWAQSAEVGDLYPAHVSCVRVA